MKDDTLLKNNTGFLCGNDSPYYMEKLTFSAVLKHMYRKNAKHKISCIKNFISVHIKLLPLNADQNFKMKSVITLI